VFVAAHRPLSWAAAAVAAAVVLDPVVDRLSPYVHRVPAVLLTLLALAAIGVGTTYLVFDEIDNEVEGLKTSAPEDAAAIEDRTDRVGELARDFGLTDRVEAVIEGLDERVAGGSDVLRTTAGTAPTYLVGAILTIFFMTYGPRMARSALDQYPDPARRARVAATVGPAIATARTAVLLTVAVAAAVGVAVSLVATTLDLPAPSAIGFVAAVFTLLPHVGLVVGALPLLLLTLGFQTGATAFALAGIVLVLQAADSLVVRPRIARRSLSVGLFVPWVVALIGYAVYGVGAAAYGLLYAVFGLAVLDRLVAQEEARAQDEPVPHQFGP